RGKDRVDIFGGGQGNVGQHGANGSRTLGNQGGRRERYSDIEAARKFLVDSERICGSRHREQARVGRHHRDVVGGIGADRGGQHVAKHRFGQRTAFIGRQRRREARLGEFE